MKENELLYEAYLNLRKELILIRYGSSEYQGDEK